MAIVERTSIFLAPQGPLPVFMVPWRVYLTANNMKLSSIGAPRPWRSGVVLREHLDDLAARSFWVVVHRVGFLWPWKLRESSVIVVQIDAVKEPCLGDPGGCWGMVTVVMTCLHLG